jgi:2-polyprenyl-3-methyl-5-hydroxy-6-metoxy-1,4-benzoquinol methylase
VASKAREQFREFKLLLRARGDRARAKQLAEVEYWESAAHREGHLTNDHYEYFFTEHFGLTRDWYTGKRILDIGCGPRGSLEWASEAAERIGLDPLVDNYRSLGIDRHAMRYIGAPAEAIPFDDGYFDVVTSFNSLDHVDDLDRTIGEIIRVLAPNGDLLLMSDVNHAPTVTEPISYSWDVVDRFVPPLTVVSTRRFKRLEAGVYESAQAQIPFDGAAPDAAGLLSAHLTARDGPASGLA